MILTHNLGANMNPKILQSRYEHPCILEGQIWSLTLYKTYTDWTYWFYEFVYPTTEAYILRESTKGACGRM